MSEEPIFLDYQSTTPLDPAVLEEMLPWMGGPANPHSTENAFGLRAQEAVNTARSDISKSLNCDPEGVLFTSGATEAANLVLQSFAGANRKIILSAVEHSCITETARELRTRGALIETVGVDEYGLIDLEELSQKIEGATLLSVMAVNNEIGTIQPIQDIANVAEMEGVPYLCDASQALGRIFLSDTAGLTYRILSSHKIYGPAGIGAIVAHPDDIQALKPLMYGGAQQSGVRPGTLPTALCVGFARAIMLAETRREEDWKTAELNSAAFIECLRAQNLDFVINGGIDDRVPHNLNIYFSGVHADALLNSVPNLALSTGSACRSGAIEASGVLTAIGCNTERASNSIRVGFGRFSNSADVILAANILAKAVLQQVSSKASR